MIHTHSISIPGLLYIDGIPNDHECDSDGDRVYQTKSGKRVTWNTHKKWAGLTTMAREPILFAHYDAEMDPILSCSVSCSKCKGVLMNQMAWI